MGVVNVTPDSFSDGGRFFSVGAAVEHGLRLAQQGAALIDVGGESTRPGAEPVGTEEELRRVVPVIERLRAGTTAIISVDTSKPEVMRAASAAGAGLINDVRALREPGALAAAAASGCAVCLMHMQGEPRTMQRAPSYADVVGEVRTFLAGRVAESIAAGLTPERLVVDPGFGFGKTLEHNLALLRRLGELAADGPANHGAGAGGAGRAVAQIDAGYTHRARGRGAGVRQRGARGDCGAQRRAHHSRP